MRILILAFTTIVTFYSCKQEEESPLLSSGEVQKQILDKAREVVWGLNHKDSDTLMSQFWKSDDALFIINGNMVKGYDNIEKGLKQGMLARKLFQLKITNEFVEVFTPVSAMHVAEFEQEVTDQNDSTFTEKGSWSAFYRKLEDEWKVVLVHESYYPLKPKTTPVAEEE
ncbi:hypothetical protein [Aegicerativicinus sediminis]